MTIETAQMLRRRAQLLEFLKFRVLAAQEGFFSAWGAVALGQGGTAAVDGWAQLDLVAFRRWLLPLFPQAAPLSDDDLRQCLRQAHQLYVDPPRHP